MQGTAISTLIESAQNELENEEPTVKVFLNALYFTGYLSKYVPAHTDRWNRRVIAEYRCLYEPQGNDGSSDPDDVSPFP